MCGRYLITSSPEAVRNLFRYPEEPDFPPRYNIAPTQPIPIVLASRDGGGLTRHFVLARWGFLPGFVKAPKDFPLIINARAETLGEKASFRAAVMRRRCLVILLTDIDDGAAAGQLAGAARLLQPQHLLFVVGLGSAAFDAFAREPGEDWLDPYRTLAAEEGRLHRRRSLEALAAGGVRAIVTAPAGLERAVFDAYARLRRQRSV